MQTFYIGNSLLGDELSITQQLIGLSDILICFAADVLDRTPLAAPYGGGRRCPIGVPHIGRSLAPYRLLNKNCPPP